MDRCDGKWLLHALPFPFLTKLASSCLRVALIRDLRRQVPCARQDEETDEEILEAGVVASRVESGTDACHADQGPR